MWKIIALSFLNRAMALLLGELWQFLQDSVATYADTALTGAQKRDAVMIDALGHCQIAGLAISTSLLNLGVEAAVQIMNGKDRD